MRSLAGFALTWASVFLAIVAILIGSQALFFITTAMIATLCACHLQAYLSVRWLRVERVVPPSAQVGDLVTVQITLWSEKPIRRPLVAVADALPAGLPVSDRSPSLPIAPSFDEPVRTQYRFRPLKRGRFRWSGLMVEGTDVLGLVTRGKEYPTAPTEMIVLPRPIPCSIELPTAGGWGVSEAESGQTRGAGIEPRGIREYRAGDPLRHVHWRSTARTGKVVVKEFEAGSQATVALLIDRQKGHDVGKGAETSLEIMVGHAAFLIETLLRQGVRVLLPQIDPESPNHANVQERTVEAMRALALLDAEHGASLSQELSGLLLPGGSVAYVFHAVADSDLARVAANLQAHGVRVMPLVYDAGAFGRSPLTTAVDAQYVDNLQASGMTPQVMTVAESSDRETLSEGRRAPSLGGNR
jgi:uncharacterized protein (DUF58 family)